jgi:hypothetical protein
VHKPSDSHNQTAKNLIHFYISIKKKKINYFNFILRVFVSVWAKLISFRGVCCRIHASCKLNFTNHMSSIYNTLFTFRQLIFFHLFLFTILSFYLFFVLMNSQASLSRCFEYTIGFRKNKNKSLLGVSLLWCENFYVWKVRSFKLCGLKFQLLRKFLFQLQKLSIKARRWALMNIYENPKLKRVNDDWKFDTGDMSSQWQKWKARMSWMTQRHLKFNP